MIDPRTLVKTENTQKNVTNKSGMIDPRTLVSKQTFTTNMPQAEVLAIHNNVLTNPPQETAGPSKENYYTALLKKEIEDTVNAENVRAIEEERVNKQNNPFMVISNMNDEIVAKIQGEQNTTQEVDRPTLLREHVAGLGSLGLTDVFQEQSKKNKDVTAKVYDEYLEKLRTNEAEYVKKLGQDNYNKLFEEIYNNSSQKPIDRDFFTQLRLNVGGGNVQGVTNILNTGAMLLNDNWGKNVSDATQWSRDLNSQILQGNQNRGGLGAQVLNASNTVGNMIPTIAAASVNPALGKAALFGNAAGSAYNEALDNGASLGQAKGNAILSGGAELAIESLSGGLSNKLLGSKALFNPSNLTKKIGNKFVKGAVDLGLEVVGEGLEEVASTALQPVIDRITYNPNSEFATGEELWRSFTDSILPTLLMQGLGAATNGINSYHDTQVEQIKNSNLPQEQQTELINKTTEQRDKLLNEVQNNTQNAQNTPNIENISQNNVQNAQDLKKTGQNNSVDEALARATTDKSSKGKIILGKINDFAKNKIQRLLGIDVSNRQHTLADNDIRHMLNEHGNAEIEAKRGQIPITEADVKRIPSIIDSPDDIILGSRHQDGQTVRYIKKFEDGINFVVEVVPEKSGALKIKTMWKKPIAVVNSTNTPNLTSKTEGNIINSTSSNNIIQSNENYVNNQENILPSVEQLQASDLKRGKEISNTLNMKKPESEENTNQEKVAEILNDSEKSKTSLKELAKETVNDFKRAFVDAGTDIAEIGKITNDKTLYHMFNSAKQSGQSANYMISEAQTNLQGDTVGKSLMDIFEPIRQKGQDYYKEFEYYMYHLHNIDRMQQGKPVFGKNVTVDDSRNIVKEFEIKYPKFPEYAEDIRKWNANLQQFRIDTGLISQDQADMMNEMYPNYVPTYRETNGISGATKSGSVVKIVDTIKKATGSNKNILPLHEQMARQVMQTVQAGRRNILGKQLYIDTINNADKLGKYVREIKTTKEDTETDADFDFEKQDLEGKFIVYDNGDKIEMQVSDGVLEGLKSLSSAKWESNVLSRGMKKVNSTFKKLVTEWNPAFVLKNASRDIQDAGFYSENMKDFYMNYPQAWKEITSNGELWQKYLAMGGSDASLFDFEQGYVIPKAGIPAKVMQKISEANFLVEQAPRFAEFLRIYNQSDKSYNALMEAMYGAADITVNFGRSGTWGKFINNNLVPFFNPAIQGTSKTIRTITGDGNIQGGKNFAKHIANIVGKGVILGVAPTMINHILLEVFGGDNYDDLNERDKDMYFLIPVGDGKYVKIPKGRVLSVIGGFVRRGYEVVTGNKDAYDGFMEFALGQTAPSNPFESNLYAPKQAVDNNKTWYGTPIESESLQNYRPSQRYDEGTTEFAKWLGKNINYSPKKIDYLLDAYGGALADVLMPLNTKKAESSGLGKSFILDSVTSNKLSTNFYNTIEELTYDKNDDDQVAKMQLKYMNDVKDKAQDINKQIKDIQASDLEDKEKIEKVRELRKEVNTLQRDALATYEKYGEIANSYLGNDAFIEFALSGTEEYTTEETKQEKIEKTVKAYTDRDLFGAEYALSEYNKDVFEKQQKAEEQGIDSEIFFKAYFAQKGVTGDKNIITGKTTSGSEKKNKRTALDKAVGKSLTTYQMKKIYEIFNVD